MHDFSTRAGSISCQNSMISTCVLAALLCVSGIFSTTAKGAPATQEATTEISVPQSRTTHEIALEIVRLGHEGLGLTARLSENGGIIQRDVSWKIRDAQGETVFEGASSIADAPLPPGDYTVEATYGSTHFLQSLSLQQGNRLMVSFVLDIGGIRILPRIKNIGLAPAQCRSLVYAVSGHNKGKLVTISNLPGEILRVEAGDYRIESRFSSGNAVAVADVHVKPGIMSAVEIDHAAGLARLSYVGAPDASVSWQVSDAKGETFPIPTGLSANVVLKPGSYIAKAKIGNEFLTASFEIAAGQARDIFLGN